MVDTTKLVQDHALLLERQRWAAAAIDFVRSIGLSVTEGVAQDVEGAFVPGVRIVDGGLIVDPETVFPGDVLHEAGHLAVIPAKFRQLATGTLRQVFKSMTQYLKDNPTILGGWPEDPVGRCILQSGEAEAAAWQYAAAHHIGLPDQWLFPPESFEGKSEDTLLRLKVNQYFGINGLQAAGWTRVHAMGNPAKPLYPKLAFWLHGSQAGE